MALRCWIACKYSRHAVKCSIVFSRLCIVQLLCAQRLCATLRVALLGALIRNVGPAVLDSHVALSLSDVIIVVSLHTGSKVSSLRVGRAAQARGLEMVTELCT